jgi:DNA-directed RNA polymerase subunit alpha
MTLINLHNNKEKQTQTIDIRNTDINLLMSNNNIFTPIIENWIITKSPDNQITGELEIKLTPTMGLTLLHCIRRIGLSLSTTFAVACVKISNKNILPAHAFACIEGIREDIPDIHYNIKGVKIKISLIEEENSISEEVENNQEKEIDHFFAILITNIAGPVYARDIKLLKEYEDKIILEIVNPDYVICNLDVGSSLKIELLFRKSFGYVSERDNKKHFDLILPSVLREGWFYLGSSFSDGVLNITGNVVEINSGSVIYDSLKLKITTDGRIKPEQVLTNAFSILHSQIPLSCYNTNVAKITEDPVISQEENILISTMPFEDPIKRVLHNAQIFRLDQLLKNTTKSLLSLSGVGTVKVQSIITTLAKLGYTFKDSGEKYEKI